MPIIRMPLKKRNKVSRAFINGLLFLIVVLSAFTAGAQGYGEHVAPMRWNPVLVNNDKATHARPSGRTTAATLTLPFFEDFTYYGPVPDSNKWEDFEVYINNTMGQNPISRGVATFDDLDGRGIPYDSFNNSDFRFADSLTSRPIDLSANTPADSVYLSFFYQPQGNGFYPLSGDSLFLYLKDRYGNFTNVWSIPGTSLQPFQQVMIPITDTLFFHSTFQFRFVNMAALYWADAVWNVDYIRLDKNRSAGDTTVGDVAFTTNPSFLLNDYTSMPYPQFMANTAGEITSQVTDNIANDTSLFQTVNYSFGVTDAGSGLSLASAIPTALTMPGYQTQNVSEPLIISSFPAYPAGTSVVFQTQFYLESTTSTGGTANDTIVGKQVFDNYLAYDDGTAEKSYYLNLFTTLPGKIAIEYHLNRPDTLQGVAIYFGRQIPFASSKFFYVYVYTSLQGVNGAPSDVVIDSIEDAVPGYADSVNHFWYYTFPQPLVMPAGTFYMGTMQPAESGSDSLYIGLDVNRVGSNHSYYNVFGTWQTSLISGALMIRPLLGHAVQPTSVADIDKAADDWSLSPNPARDKVQFNIGTATQRIYHITDVAGRNMLMGTITNGNSVDVSQLAPGMYFVTLGNEGTRSSTKKLIKL